MNETFTCNHTTKYWIGDLVKIHRYGHDIYGEINCISFTVYANKVDVEYGIKNGDYVDESEVVGKMVLEVLPEDQKAVEVEQLPGPMGNGLNG